MWGTVLKRDLLGEIREEDRFHNKEELKEYLKSEIEKQGENVSIRNLDVSLVEDTGYMFWNCYHLESLDISRWDTSNIKDMTAMFRNCPAAYGVEVLKKRYKGTKICGAQF